MWLRLTTSDNDFGRVVSVQGKQWCVCADEPNWGVVTYNLLLIGGLTYLVEVSNLLIEMLAQMMVAMALVYCYDDTTKCNKLGLCWSTLAINSSSSSLSCDCGCGDWQTVATIKAFDNKC